MSRNLHRHYGTGHLHFITSSCYKRLPLLNPARRDLFLQILEETRKRYQFVVVGYVVMPEHFHLLISEPERGDPGVVMQVLKQLSAGRVLSDHRNSLRTAETVRVRTVDADAVLERGHFWQKRFFDYVVRTEEKRIEKLRYIHRNPVRRGLVLDPADWQWSSFRHYAIGEAGLVLVDEQLQVEVKVRTA